jgi:hypothetical protein
MVWAKFKIDSKKKWVNYAVRLDPELAEQFEEYAATVGDSKSAAFRMLVAAGLDSTWGQDTAVVTTVQANAKAAAMSRFTDLLSELLDLYRDPSFVIDSHRGRRKKNDADS